MFTFLLFAACLNGVFGSIKDCDSSSLFRPSELALSPDPPQRGDRVYMTVKFNNPDKDIADGKVVTTVVLNGIPVSPTTSPLCESTTCPIVHGLNDRSTSSVWPDISGKLTSRIVWTGANGESLLCIQVSVLVSDGSPANQTEPLAYNAW